MKVEIKKDEDNNIFGKRKYRYVWGIALIEFAIIIGIILKWGPQSKDIITKNLVYFFAYVLSAYPLFNVLNKLTKIIGNKLPPEIVDDIIKKFVK